MDYIKSFLKIVFSNFIIKLLIVFLPNKIKIHYYRLIGAHIEEDCYIGFSIVDAESIFMGKCSYIGHFNLIWRLKELKIKNGSRISMLNWITGAQEGLFKMGENSSVSIMHYFESSANIEIGSNTIIAGRSSQFFTHGITPVNLDYKGKIVIGNWCYVGSSSCFTPDSSIADYTFVGMGAVINKKHVENYTLLGGSPAKVKKKLSEEDLFFKQKNLKHSHH